jgi:OOP family OmpA-OmpF porin
MIAMTQCTAPLRHALLPALFAVALSGCGPAPDPVAADSAAGASEAGVTPAADGGRDPAAGLQDQSGAGAAGDVAREPQPAGFDIAAIPVSTAPLGDFPYFTLPEGYGNPNQPVPVRDFARVAVWTGDRLEWIEGRVFESFVHARRGKGWSKLEVERNLDHQVAQAGGTRVTASRPPREVVDAWNAGQDYSPGRGDIHNNETSTWLVRRPDRDIWLHFTANSASGSWMVIESAAFVPTASLLPATEMQRQLDADGRVALQVNFATDKADILPGSLPQVDQVLQLLRTDPSLRLSIDGHTDASGDAAHNQRLSQARAQAVVAALAAQGIDAARLKARGHGQSMPVADNATSEGKAANRRVELVRL